MKNKILGLSVCMLLIATSVFPVVGIADIVNHVDSEAYKSPEISTTIEPVSGGRDNNYVWVNPSPETVGGPSVPREYPVMAYNSSADRTIMFGGYGEGYRKNDTWAYDFNANTWTNMSALPTYSEVGGTLTPRNQLHMVYDSDADMTIMFGGKSSNPTTFHNDTWSYSYASNTWRKLSALPTYGEVGGPLIPRALHRMVYDSGSKRVIMFGGYTGTGRYLNETWVYNSSDNHWYNMSSDAVAVGETLPVTLSHAMAYDSSADRTIMFGGMQAGDGWTNYTWAYNLSGDGKWYNMTPETFGGTLWSRRAHVMVYDPDADRTIIFGGQKVNHGGQYNDTWVYNFTDNKWYKMNPEIVGGTLYRREYPAMVYDSTHKKTILFGGFSNDLPPGEMLNDTWMFKYNIGNEPPNPPTNPVPANGSLDVDIDADLSWYCWDPDLDDLTYDVYFEAGDSTPDVKVSSNQTDTTYDPGTMNYNETYYWQIVSWDTLSQSTAGPIWHFTTREVNYAPNTPSDPDPEDGATDVDINADLSWNCSDPDGDNLTYDVYFEANDPTPDVMVSNNQSETTYDPGEMEYSTHYYWKIVAWDPYQCTEGPIWDFTTGSNPNNPPYVPSDPDPENGSTDVDIDADMSWTGGDPDPDDTVVYDVYLEANDPTPDNKVADDILETTFDPDTLEYETVYYWRIIAKDNHGASTWGPVWHFTTELAPVPDLDCEGSLIWTRVKPGDTVFGNFTVKNIGASGSELSWSIKPTAIPDWGEWIVNPMNGTGLTPEAGPVTVEVFVVAPKEKNKEFTEQIKVVNLEDPFDNEDIPVSLTTPKNKAFNFYVNILMWLFERFPNAFPILRYMLGL